MKGPKRLTRVDQFQIARRSFQNVVLTRTGIALPLRPTQLSPTYQVRIDYVPERSPKVFVVSPALLNATLHVYADGSICLYYRGEYDNTLPMSETIIPWTAQWLYCYEIWLVQGEWPAPESPHRGTKTQDPLTRRRDDR